MTLAGAAAIAAGGVNGRRAGQAAGAVAAAIAAAALVGWWAGVPMLWRWAAGLPGISVTAAACLAALGFALLHGDRRLAVVVGVVVAALAALLLLFRLDAGMEWLALSAPAPGADGLPGDTLLTPLTHTSSLAFGLAGAALACSRFERAGFASTVMAVLAAAVAVFALLAYLTGIDALYGTSSLVAPPLPTATGLLLVAVGIVMRTRVPALRRPQPLWHLLAVLGCAIVMPLLLFGAYAEVGIADAHLREVRRTLLQEARALSADVDRGMFGEIARLDALAASPSLREGDFAAFRRQAEASLASRPGGGIMLVDRDVEVLVDTAPPGEQGPDKAALAEPVARALMTGVPQFTGPFMRPGTRDPMFAIVVPAAIDGENVHALLRSISRHFLCEPINGENLPRGWQAVISDVGGHVLVRSGQGGSDGEMLPASQQGNGPAGVLEFVAEGQPFVQAFAWSAVTGWQTAVSEPKALVEAPVLALWRTLSWLAILSVALVMAPALWLSRIIARSVGWAARDAVVGAGAAVETPVAEVNALMGQLRDAAARRQASEDLVRNSERQLRLVTDNVPVAIWRCDTEGRYTFVNREFMERHGLPGERIVGRTARETIGEEAAAAEQPWLAKCLAGIEVECDLELVHRGRPLFVHNRYVPEWWGDEVAGVIGASIDITHLKEAERRLRASEAGFRHLIDCAPFGIYVVDEDYRIVLASAGAQATFDLLGRDLLETMQSLWREPFASESIEIVRRTFRTGEAYHSPSGVMFRSTTGKAKYFDWRIERLTMPDGRYGIVCYFYDLSERRRYEDALREREVTFRAMFDSSAVGKAQTDLETGRLLLVNAAMARFLGYTEAELMERSVSELTHPDDREADRVAMRAMAAGELSVFEREKRYIRKDGTAVWARLTANVIRGVAGRPRSAAVIQDLNERKRTEQNLQASRRRLQLALDAARLGWFQYDPVRRCVRGDARFKAICELGADETPLEELLARIHADDRGRALADLAATLDPDVRMPPAVEYRLQRRDGPMRWVEIHGLTNYEGTGRERRLVSLIGTVQDITERKEHEERTQLLLREMNHRSKNIMSVVDAIAHQTAATAPDDFIARFSERIQALAANQDLLVRNEWKGVDLGDLVVAQLAHFADLIGSRIVVRGEPLRLTAASAQAIGLALHELSTNAGKYGALSTDTGNVAIGWSTEGDTFCMHWCETGGPPVLAPKRRGFGGVVMETMAERSLAGKVVLDYAAAGVTWNLGCPAVNVLERQDDPLKAFYSKPF